MTTLEFRWSVSRGRNTYGYNICSLYADGRKVASCNGGGYDMKGTSLGNYIASAYADRLLQLKPEQMEEHSHWERNPNPAMLCEDVECLIKHSLDDADPHLPAGTEKCPHCGSETRIDYHDGKSVYDGRYFYGLSYHDPNYDPGKAIVGKDCSDRTLGGAGDKVLTVAEAEAAGISMGLERYQAFYSASSKVPTERHVIPSIDGGCGFSSVERIMKAIGLSLEYVPTRSKKSSIYVLKDEPKELAEPQVTLAI